MFKCMCDLKPNIFNSQFVKLANFRRLVTTPHKFQWMKEEESYCRLCYNKQNDFIFGEIKKYTTNKLIFTFQ